MINDEGMDRKGKGREKEVELESKFFGGAAVSVKRQKVALTEGEGEVVMDMEVEEVEEIVSCVSEAEELEEEGEGEEDEFPDDSFDFDEDEEEALREASIDANLHLNFDLDLAVDDPTSSSDDERPPPAGGLKRGRSLVSSSYQGISSPPISSPLPFVKRQRTTPPYPPTPIQDIPEEDKDDQRRPFPSQFDQQDTLTSPACSSGAPEPEGVKQEPPAPRVADVVKKEVVSRKADDYMFLSSDPIEPDEEEEKESKEILRMRLIKGKERAREVKVEKLVERVELTPRAGGVRGKKSPRDDTPKVSQGRRKEEKVEPEDEEGQEEEDAVVRSVAASWRAKFSFASAASSKKVGSYSFLFFTG